MEVGPARLVGIGVGVEVLSNEADPGALHGHGPVHHPDGYLVLQVVDVRWHPDIQVLRPVEPDGHLRVTDEVVGRVVLPEVRGIGVGSHIPEVRLVLPYHLVEGVPGPLVVLDEVAPEVLGHPPVAVGGSRVLLAPVGVLRGGDEPYGPTGRHGEQTLEVGVVELAEVAHVAAAEVHEGRLVAVLETGDVGPVERRGPVEPNAVAHVVGDAVARVDPAVGDADEDGGAHVEGCDVRLAIEGVVLRGVVTTLYLVVVVQDMLVHVGRDDGERAQ